MFFAYVLRLANKSFYKGLTKNIENRLKEHKSGKVKATKSKLPVELVHVEICDSRLESRHLEKYLKSGYGREIIQELFGK